MNTVGVLPGGSVSEKSRKKQKEVVTDSSSAGKQINLSNTSFGDNNFDNELKEKKRRRNLSP